jgi:hypothetical protein
MDPDSVAPGAENEYVTEYARNAYAEARDWYKQAELKAHILITLDGALITALFASAVVESEKSEAIVAQMPLAALVILGTTVIALLASLVAALLAVRSTLYREAELTDGAGEFPTPRTAWFFQFLTRHKPEALLAHIRADRQSEATALLANLPKLSENVTFKHRCVNRGLELLIAALLALLVAAALTLSSRVGH